MTFPNRTMCAALSEMRKCFETYNFGPIPGLIEEVQSMGNRMEAALEDKDDIERWKAERDELHKEVQKLRKERNKIKKKVGKKVSRTEERLMT